ncbi:MAG: CaiB/BaiF CoA-transferase family protein [Peptococcaceae bacterium]|jgi:CoA:oxalate CoA-transferase|nr:CoA transferase [Peptococcaceae bacterium]MDH7526396.1 CaiB/BaiF CoA-transferase family protein [Peptococcaceae bacterium]
MLNKIKIIDLTRNLAGPYCTMLLADLGADVLKVEAPGVGDDARGFGPFIKGESGYFISVNRGKKGMTLNLKDKRGAGILRKLLEKADVLIESFRPGVLDRLGFSYDEVAKINPGIVYASISGFGQTGPYRDKPAYDMVVQGYGGIMSVTGQPAGIPTRVGVSIGDLAASLFCASGILAALLNREKTGQGDRIDISMLDCQVALLENSIVRYAVTEQNPIPIGNRHASITPFEALKTKDGYVIVCCGNQGLWEKYCEVIGHPELLEDRRFRDNNKRTENQPALSDILTKIMSKKTTQEWLGLLEKAGIPCAPINNISQVLNNEQVGFREMIVTLNHPRAGEVKVSGCPVKSMNCKTGAVQPSPLLGQHNEEVLSSLGFTAEEIAVLKQDKVI